MFLAASGVPVFECRLNKCPMIHFSENEEKIANVIREYARSLDPPTVARFAGGWVRDKVMGMPSSDIDVTLDNISGYSFATGLSAKYADIWDDTQHSEERPVVSTVHKIQANPDKSKHLETAVVSIFGISIDFAHLRNEKYTTTRIPTILPGTPLEDAMRRDLTINALFFNLETNQLEDFTGKGLEDIKNGIIRTPMDPRVTLYEDPLRILRIFRFKAKLQFEIDDRVYDALKLPKISSALQNKVSNERIEAEISKMLRYENGYVGIHEIIATGYINPVFKPSVSMDIDREKSMNFYINCQKIVSSLENASQTDGRQPDADIDGGCGRYSESIKEATSDPSPSHPEQGKIADGLCRISFLNDTHKPPVCRKDFVWSKVEKATLWLYMILHSFTGIKVLDKNKLEYVNVLVIKNSLKGSKAKTTRMKNLERSMDYLCDRKNNHIVRLLLFCREHTFESLLICAVKSSDHYFTELLNRVIDSGACDCYTTEPVVKGDDLRNMGVPAQRIKFELLDCLVYQIEHPAASKEEILRNYRGGFI